MVPSEKSVYEYVVYDSDNEASFVERFENNESIKLYAKLPDWFKINTPIGTYNPDWAVLMEKDGDQRLYFVLETKAGTKDQLLFESLRDKKIAKILCGEAHFKALDTDVQFKTIKSFEGFIEVT